MGVGAGEVQQTATSAKYRLGASTAIMGIQSERAIAVQLN